MDVLIKNATILDPNSPHDGENRDILVNKGIITKISKSISSPSTQSISSDATYVSPGWMDTFGYLGDPGEEHKETIDTGLESAARGGYTAVIAVPNTSPPISNASQIEYLLARSSKHITQLLPAGSITKDAQGTQLAEMMDMAKHGAVAFTDGLNPIQSDGLMMRALEYIKSVDATLISLPISQSMQKLGQMHEGDYSVKYGMMGIPYLSETLVLHREIELAKYLDSKIHIAAVSTAESVNLLRQAKKDGVNITAAVSPFHLVYTDADLGQYDSNLKLHLPLRTEKDRKSLIKAVNDGTIDTIASHHFPVHPEAKQVEFNYAEPGMISYQTTLPLLIKSGVQMSRYSELLSGRPRSIFGRKPEKIAEGEKANITIFDTKMKWTLNEKSNASVSKNTILWNTELEGQVIAVINNNKLKMNKL